MGISLCGGGLCVTKKFSKNAHTETLGYEMRGIGVTQIVDSHIL